jgi:hypothetical protein
VRVITPTGRVGTIVQTVEGCALVRFHTGRGWFRLDELEPAPPRKSQGIDQGA